MQDWFRCDTGYETRASAVQDKAAKLRVKDMYYEAHVQVLVTCYADTKDETLPKKVAKRMLHYPDTDLAKELYMQVITKHYL